MTPLPSNHRPHRDRAHPVELPRQPLRRRNRPAAQPTPITDSRACRSVIPPCRSRIPEHADHPWSKRIGALVNLLWRHLLPSSPRSPETRRKRVSQKVVHAEDPRTAAPEVRARAQPPRDRHVARHRQQHGERLLRPGKSAGPLLAVAGRAGRCRAGGGAVPGPATVACSPWPCGRSTGQARRPS